MSGQQETASRLNNSELWGGVVGLALGTFVVWAALDLGLGTINDPGSGFVLFYTGLLMCVFAATIIISAITEGGPTFRSRWEDASWGKPLVIIAALIVYA
jgi:putative tricarboxylic transport membrane protein